MTGISRRAILDYCTSLRVTRRNFLLIFAHSFSADDFENDDE